MGANTNRYVASAKPNVGGGIYWAPGGAALPTDATTSLASEFECLGAISSGGVRPSRNTSQEKVREWDGSVLANLLTEEDRGFEFDLYSVHDQDTLNFIFGADNVSVTPAAVGTGTVVAVEDKGGQQPTGVLVIDMLDQNGGRTRKVCGAAQPVITSEGPYVPGALRQYTAQVEASKDEAGVFVYEYSQLNDALSA